jgi:hypothetical protein
MALQNIGYLIEVGKKTGPKLLFDITLLDQRFKCLFLTETLKFIIVAQAEGRGTIAHFDAQGEQIGDKYFPSEFYHAICNTICQLDNGNKNAKLGIFWKAFDEKILTTKFTIANDNESYKMLRTTSTADKWLKDGGKPFFLSFVRNTVCNVSIKNLRKTEYYLGKKYRDACEKNNISTRWTNDIATSKAACFFYPTLLEEKYNDILNKQK